MISVLELFCFDKAGRGAGDIATGILAALSLTFSLLFQKHLHTQLSILILINRLEGANDIKHDVVHDITPRVVFVHMAGRSDVCIVLND